jgi:two-component system, sensor histidine kinase and response regulator
MDAILSSRMPSHSLSDITSNRDVADVSAGFKAPGPASPSKPVLLVVDDEEGPRQSVRIIFKDEYQVLLAHNGEQAVELARQHPVSVVVSDILMTGMSGIDVLRDLKQIDPAIEVIMLTAYETIETARQALRLGACDYLNKPFDVQTMRAAVARAREKNEVSKNVFRSNETLRALQQEIQDQQVKEEMMRTKGEIYASVLHDINSPLTVISGFVDIINRSLGDSATVEGEKLEIIKGDLNKLTGQVGRCFEISRRYLSFLRDKDHAGGSGGSDGARVGLNQILTDLKELLIRHPSSRGNQLAVHLLPQERVAAINGTDLLQILLNLTINALTCTDNPHRVEVSAQFFIEPFDTSNFVDTESHRFINREGFVNQPPLLAISVQDDGPGIPPEVLAKMFETKFTTKAAGKGTGLGLGIVKRLVKAGQGAIHVQTAVGKGSTFTICLPGEESGLE